jgi:malate dehydrogenase (oxaloacetate-decarboxylating)(NADP+)
LAEIALLAAERVRELGIEPRIAMLSFSNFGDARHPESEKVAKATQLLKNRRPDLMVEGEMQANVALNEKERAPYPFSALKGEANVLIFPNLDAGNAAYKLLGAQAGVDVIGPMVLGIKKPVAVLQQGATVDSIVHMSAITASRAIHHQRRQNRSEATP